MYLGRRQNVAICTCKCEAKATITWASPNPRSIISRDFSNNTVFSDLLVSTVFRRLSCSVLRACRPFVNVWALITISSWNKGYDVCHRGAEKSWNYLGNPHVVGGRVAGYEVEKNWPLLGCYCCWSKQHANDGTSLSHSTRPPPPASQPKQRKDDTEHIIFRSIGHLGNKIQSPAIKTSKLFNFACLQLQFYH